MKANLFLCNGFSSSLEKYSDYKIETLDAIGPEGNVNIKFDDISSKLFSSINNRSVDLLEIASYIYAADSGSSRGTGWSNDGCTENWSRNLEINISVRDYEFWNQSEIKSILHSILVFLSDDKYLINFSKLDKDRSYQDYLPFNCNTNLPFEHCDKIVMFSGGLDSLSGTIECLEKKENLILISHSPIGKTDSRLKELALQLKVIYPNQIFHIPICINKESRLFKEYTQRTRSFLYASLGTIISQLMMSDKVFFFENGVVSLNLPIADEVIRARASRTTHPKFLNLFSLLASKILDRKISFENPFIFKTKRDVVELIAKNNRKDLIALSSSCSHTYHKSKLQWHCGHCSQCIDRKVAIESLNLELAQEEIDYQNDVFTSPRNDGYDRNIAINFSRHVFELNNMNEIEFLTKFNMELSRAARYFNDKQKAIDEFIRMHLEYGKYAVAVIEKMFNQNSNLLLKGKLNDASMLGMLAGKTHIRPYWLTYTSKIYQLLNQSIPLACATEKPSNEKRLQELCDSILVGHDYELIREFPFLRWASRLTKPDWSNEQLSVWVELKYIRQKTDINQITEDIAADITKYGDNNRFTIFIIYDPSHLLVEENEFRITFKKYSFIRIEFVR